jgi:hypothetical protein
MKKAINKGFALHLYLDFVNNYLTIEQMALNKNINPYALANLLKHGKRINEQKAKQIKEQKAWFEYLAR